MVYFQNCHMYDSPALHPRLMSLLKIEISLNGKDRLILSWNQLQFESIYMIMSCLTNILGFSIKHEMWYIEIYLHKIHLQVFPETM